MFALSLLELSVVFDIVDSIYYLFSQYPLNMCLILGYIC